LRDEAVEVGDLIDVVRIASERPLKDAAFFIAFNIRNGRIEENAHDAMKSSHMGVSDSEISEAIAASNKLEAYCRAMPRGCLDDPDKARSVLQKAKDDNPGYTSETYDLIEGYVRSNEEEIEFGEQNDQDENLVANREWSDIPYFRKPFFLVLTFLIFMPAYLILIWSGDTYYRKNGVVYRTSLKRKRRMTVIVLVLIALYFLRSVG
jgi:hypothetical protein